jgi:hypothetical protein
LLRVSLKTLPAKQFKPPARVAKLVDARDLKSLA